MSDWLISLEGTPAGQDLALALAISAAFLHAVFGAIQKGRHDPWLTRGVIDTCLAIMAAPCALFLVPFPEPYMWPLFAVAVLIHMIYKMLQAQAYTKGAYTVVYPVVRGASPLFAVIGAYLIFGESFNITQWLGVAVLLSGIFGLAIYNLIFLSVERETLPAALAFAVATGLVVALYTTFDAYAIRATADPFTFLAWFFMFEGMIMPFIAFAHWRRMSERPTLGPLFARGCIGAVLAVSSFGAVMLATRLGNVGEAAVMRETSVVFAAIIGVLFLRDTVGPRRIVLMILIALGAVIVEMGG